MNTSHKGVADRIEDGGVDVSYGRAWCAITLSLKKGVAAVRSEGQPVRSRMEGSDENSSIR